MSIISGHSQCRAVSKSLDAKCKLMIVNCQRYLISLYVQIGRLNAGPPFFTYINPAQPLVADPDPEKKDSEKFSEKYNKMKQKTDKR